MAVTTPTLKADLPLARRGPLAFNNTDNDAGATLITAPTGAGESIYLTSITFSDRTVDVRITLIDEDTNTLFGPIQLQANGSGLFTKDWKTPLKGSPPVSSSPT